MITGLTTVAQGAPAQAPARSKPPAERHPLPAPPFHIVADDYSFQGVPRTIRAVPGGLATVTLENTSQHEAHEFVIVRLKDEVTRTFNLVKAKEELVRFFNFEAQADPANVGGFSPGFASATKGGLRDASMGGQAEVFRSSFGGVNTHEVEAVPPLTTESNGIDLSRPGRYLYFCPITALAQNDPHQEPHYLQDPGQIGFMTIVQ